MWVLYTVYIGYNIAILNHMFKVNNMHVNNTPHEVNLDY